MKPAERSVLSLRSKDSTELGSPNEISKKGLSHAVLPASVK